MLIHKKYKIEIDPDCQEHFGMIDKIANHYNDMHKANPRCSIEDYLNVGMMALHKAKENFNPDRPDAASFETYAFRAIKNEIEKEFQKTANALSGASAHHRKHTEGTEEEIQSINGSMVSLSVKEGDILPSFSLSGEEVKSQPKLKEIIIESGSFDPEIHAQQIELTENVVEVLDALPKEEREIIYRRIFEEDTFQDIADSMNLSWRAVNYRFHKTLEKLKGSIERRGLDVYA